MATPLTEAESAADAVQSVQWWMTHDLFRAVVGSDAYDFDEWYGRLGFGDAWADLCQKVRETFANCTGEHLDQHEDTAQ